MALLKQWRDKAYDEKANKGDIQRFWANYFNIEKEIYEQLLEDPDTEVKGTVKELAEKYGQDVMTMTGFLDGINDSLVEPNPIEEMEEDTVVSLKFDKEKLYKNMVDARFLTRKDRRSCTWSRRNPALSLRDPRWEETIPAPAEAERSIRNAAEKMHE